MDLQTGRGFLLFRVHITSHNAIYRSSSKHATVIHLHLRIETWMFDRVNGITIKMNVKIKRKLDQVSFFFEAT